MQEFKREFDIEGNDNEIAEPETVNERAEQEFGDLLFSLINYARHLGINPENALERTNKKFIRRFSYLEEQAAKAGKSLKDMSLAEMDVFWEEAKNLKGGRG